MKNLLLTATAAAGLAIGSFAVARTHSPVAEVGKAAPAFSAKDTVGQTINLSDYAGKYVVLEWTNHQCPFVVKHYGSGNIPSLQKYAKDHGVIWISIVSSAPGSAGYVTAEKANAIMKQYNATPTAKILDPEGTIGRAYGAKTTPDIRIIDPRGVLIYAGGIDDTPTPDVEDLKTAHNYVKAALEEALAGKPITVSKSQPYGCGIKYAH